MDLVLLLRFILGMPKGFNKVGPLSADHPGPIRLWTDDDKGLRSGSWNKFNVPVWAMEHDGHLFVRTFSPRVNILYIDVIKGGTMELLKDFPAVYNVSDFIDEID